jgi:hypothetical protein
LSDEVFGWQNIELGGEVEFVSWQFELICSLIGILRYRSE